MVSNLSELQIWIEGQFALIAQSQKSAHDDLTTIRGRVHDLAGEIAKVSALNLPVTLSQLQEADRKHETEIARFVSDAAKREGALAAIKALYVILGAAIGGALALFFKFYQMFQK